MDPMLTGIPFVDAHGALRPGQLLEVCGVGGSGKTEILMQAAVHAVTPRRRGGVAFNGCEASVLLIDLDGKFDTLRLIKILTGKIRDTVDEASARAYGGTHSADASTSSTFPGFHPGSQTQRRDDVPRRTKVRAPVRPRRGPTASVRRRSRGAPGQDIRRMHGTIPNHPVPLLFRLFKSARRRGASVSRTRTKGEGSGRHIELNPARGFIDVRGSRSQTRGHARATTAVD